MSDKSEEYAAEFPSDDDFDKYDRGGDTPENTLASPVECHTSDGSIEGNVENESKSSDTVIKNKIGEKNKKYPEFRFVCQKDKLTQYPPEEPKYNILHEDQTAASLHRAIQKNNIDRVRELLESGANPDVPDISTGKLPLIEATNRGYTSIVKALLIAHADVNLANIQGTTALHVSVDSKNFNKEIAQLFLERRKANYNIQDKVQQNTPLHILTRVIVSMKHTKQETMLELLEDMIPRCDLNLKNKLGNTALHILAMGKRDDENAIKLFLAGKPDLNVQNHLGETPLATAIDHGNYKMALIILDYDVDINVRDRCQYTFLHYAAKKNASEIVKKLLEKGADVNARDPNGDTALHIAAGRGFHRVVFELIQHPEIELDQPNQGGYTPLLSAVDSGFLRVVQMLIEAGSNRTIRSTETQKNIIDIAEEQTKRNKRDIYDYLQSLGEESIDHTSKKSSVSVPKVTNGSSDKSESYTPRKKSGASTPKLMDKEPESGPEDRPEDKSEARTSMDLAKDLSYIVAPKDESVVDQSKDVVNEGIIESYSDILKNIMEDNVSEVKSGDQTEKAESGSPKEETSELVRKTSEELLEEINDQPPEEIITKEPEETPEETDKEAPEEIITKEPEETPEETDKEAPEEIITKEPEETPEESGKEAPEETGEEAPEETGEKAPEETGEKAPEETGEEAPEETGEEAPEEISNE